MLPSNTETDTPHGVLVLGTNMRIGYLGGHTSTPHDQYYTKTGGQNDPDNPKREGLTRCIQDVATPYGIPKTARRRSNILWNSIEVTLGSGHDD